MVWLCCGGKINVQAFPWEVLILLTFCMISWMLWESRLDTIIYMRNSYIRNMAYPVHWSLWPQVPVWRRSLHLHVFISTREMPRTIQLVSFSIEHTNALINHYKSIITINIIRFTYQIQKEWIKTTHKRRGSELAVRNSEQRVGAKERGAWRRGEMNSKGRSGSAATCSRYAETVPICILYWGMFQASRVFNYLWSLVAFIDVISFTLSTFFNV